MSTELDEVVQDVFVEVDTLAKFALETKLEDVPQEVIDFARHLTLKTIGGMLAGARFAPGPAMVELVRSRGLPEEVRVVGCDYRTSLWEGVFLSNFVAHATETEDDRLEHGVAWDIAIVPVLLTVADKLRLSGKELLEAIIVGLEVHSRSSNSQGEAQGMWLFPVAVGPAAAVSRVMGLDHQQTMYAMGMGLSGPVISETNLGSDAHCFESAMQVLQAIIAVDAAKAGMTSNPDLRGFLERFVGPENVFPDEILGGLGEEWALLDICIKKYPACSCIHRPADALRELMREHEFGYDDVEEFVVEIAPFDVFNDRPEPASVGDAKFSYQHCLAAVLLDGTLNFDNIRRIDDPKYVEARRKVKLNVHADWSPLTLVSPNGVTIKLKDGRELQRMRQDIHGSRSDPLTDDEFKELFTDFVRDILTPEQIEETVGLIMKLEELDNLDDLLKIVAPIG